MWVIEMLILTIGGPVWAFVELRLRNNAFWKLEDAIEAYKGISKGEDYFDFHTRKIRIRNAVTHEVIPTEIL